jgi:hypothetical protein
MPQKRKEKQNEYDAKSSIRVRIPLEEFELIKEYRRIKDEAQKEGIDPTTVKHGWVKSDKSSLFVKNPLFKTDDERKLDLIKKDIIDWVKYESKEVKLPKYNRAKEGKLLIINPADVHIGKLCTMFETSNEYNSQIAVKRVLEGVQGILENAKGWDIEKIVLIGGNDILHVDTPKNTTTAGTNQDTDGLWYENFIKASKLYQDLINILAKVAPVRFIYNPSNHDYTNGFFLAQLIQAYFHNDKRVEFDVDIKHRKYFKYGNNLIGTTHGDGAKWQDLASIMAFEKPKEWGETKHRYYYCHHVHHKINKDLIGCTVETVRSPSGSDGWHTQKGYVGVPKAIEGFIHCKKHGQISRLTHIF